MGYSVVQKKVLPTPVEFPRALDPIQLTDLGPDLPSMPLRSLPSIHGCHQFLTSDQYAGSSNVSQQLFESIPG